jgi:peptidoglycan/xylan/chitin deacetylase (PgdA/CDA1 family)
VNQCTVCLSFDFDAIAIWLIRGETTPTPISRGEFGARQGVPRLLDLLAEHNIPATFFVPGHTCDTFPELVGRIARSGHEVANHGYCHEVPATLSRDEEAAVLERGSAAIARATGVRPRGYRSPSWDLSPHSLDLLLAAGFKYDSSLMADDFTPYLCRKGDEGDTSGPYRFGTPVDLVELPVSWLLDDYPHFEWIARRGGGLAPASQVEEIWREEFEFMYEKVPGGIFTLTMHPQVIGRGHRIRMLDRLIRHMKGRAGVRFTTMEEAAEATRPNLLWGGGVAGAARPV